jgi:phosphoglucan,water dikinase
MRNDAPDSAIAMRQDYRLVEIGLEGFIAGLLSRITIALAASGIQASYDEGASILN